MRRDISKMTEGKKLLLSSGVASLVAPTLFTAFLVLFNQSSPLNFALLVFVVAWVVTVFHLLLLGLPFFILLQRYDSLGWLEVALAGSVAGFVPIGLLSFPLLSIGGKDATTWINYRAACLPYALLGAITAIVLWRVKLTVDCLRR